MIVDGLDCDSLQIAWFKTICEGTSGLAESDAAAYRKLWLTGGVSPPQQNSPGILAQAWNLASSLAAFIADGCETVSPEDYSARLAICDTCDRRQGNFCRECGCNLSLKATGRAFKCPLNKWPPQVTNP